MSNEQLLEGLTFHVMLVYCQNLLAVIKIFLAYKTHVVLIMSSLEKWKMMMGK